MGLFSNIRCIANKKNLRLCWGGFSNICALTFSLSLSQWLLSLLILPSFSKNLICFLLWHLKLIINLLGFGALLTLICYVISLCIHNLLFFWVICKEIILILLVSMKLILIILGELFRMIWIILISVWVIWRMRNDLRFQ